MKVFRFIVGLNLLVVFNSAVLFPRYDSYRDGFKNRHFKGIRDEPAARALLQQTYDNRDTWDAGFPGFTAGVIVSENGRTETGEVTVAADGEVQVFIKDEAAQKWLAETLYSIVKHRWSRPFAEADGKYPLTLGPEDGHPLGRQLFVHDDGMNTSYRVKDGQIRQVNRSLTDHKLTIDVFATSRTAEGKSLPRHFIMSTYDKHTGELLKTEECLDWYVKVGAFYLPHARKVAITEKGERTVRSMKLYHLRIKNVKIFNHLPPRTETFCQSMRACHLDKPFNCAQGRCPWSRPEYHPKQIPRRHSASLRYAWNGITKLTENLNYN